jgi:hypothetical protein
MGCTVKSDAVVLNEEETLSLTLTLTLSRTAGEGREAGRGKAEGEIFMVFEAPGHDSWRGGTYA